MKHLYLPLLVVVTLSALLSSPTVKAQCGLSATGTAGTSGNNTSAGTLAWVNTGATTALDANYAAAGSVLSTGIFPITTITQYLTLSNFGFTIPNTYNTCGIGVSISRGYAALLALNGSVTDNTVQLATISSPTAMTLLGTNQASGTGWPYGVIGTANYGGNGLMMGTSLTTANIDLATFGVAISANVVTNGLGLLVTADIDKVSVSIYTNPVMTLPITLESFAVTGESGGNTVRWTANADDLANKFVVQRSADGTNWKNIATLIASTGNESYTYTDATPLAGPNYYRLELVNTDGTTGYSITAIISSKTVTPGIHFYPNPFHDMINISASGTFTQVSLRDLTGRTLWVKAYPGGINSTQIPAGDLPPGLYFITVDGTTYKIIKN